MIEELKIRVVLADDHAVLRAGLKALLNAEPDIEVVGEAPDGAKPSTRGGLSQPDVIVMDIQMPHMSGLDATRAIRQSGLKSKVPYPDHACRVAVPVAAARSRAVQAMC